MGGYAYADEPFLRVRVYNVGAGDCFLLTVMDDNACFEALIDMGTNSSCTTGKKLLPRVRAQIRRDLRRDGSTRPLDLMVISHTHEDHISGFCPRHISQWKRRRSLGRTPHRIWLPIQCHKAFGLSKDIDLNTYNTIIDLQDALIRTQDKTLSNQLDRLFAKIKGLTLDARRNAKKTNRCMREVFTSYAKRRNVDYVHTYYENRFLKRIKRNHNLDITILAPVPTELYVLISMIAVLPAYVIAICDISPDQTKIVRLAARSLGFHRAWEEVADRIVSGFIEQMDEGMVSSLRKLIILFSEFDRLEPDQRKTRLQSWIREELDYIDQYLRLTRDLLPSELIFDSMMFLHKGAETLHAGNKSSVILLIDWRGNSLLFTGDMDKSEWRVINSLQRNKQAILHPISFFKVPHHGSRYNTPPKQVMPEVLDKILPMISKRDAIAVVPSCVPKNPKHSSCCRSHRSHDTSYLDDRATVFHTSSISENHLYKDFYFKPIL